ncbi:hypothetical protein SEMRO_277_G106440.1 [Seminavis robusta]|uniref:Uncharacterized protein n=1 Tax=Seminavis robusta TaxID=568900 RepID=A0A9N8HDY6_9STRA|nr:hypothetical protein SEMRO_277_G106440.1 [Seminavis robusta]|eukprot:Sro277_g106440.1 n/a (209) ;mRNA; r:81314-81940
MRIHKTILTQKCKRLGTPFVLQKSHIPTITRKSEKSKNPEQAFEESKRCKKKKKDKKKDKKLTGVQSLADVMDPPLSRYLPLEQGASGCQYTTTAAAGRRYMSPWLQEPVTCSSEWSKFTHKQCLSRHHAKLLLSQEESYSIRLEAHELFLRTALTKCEEIQDQFQVNGRAALQIGHLSKLEYCTPNQLPTQGLSRRTPLQTNSFARL